MTQTPPPATSLPHHKLFAYELCLSLVKLVAKTRVADAQLRAQARKSAASAALNCAEGAARQTRADKSRAYAIALCECCEACAAIEIAGALGARSVADIQAVVALGTRSRRLQRRLRARTSSRSQTLYRSSYGRARRLAAPAHRALH